MRTLVPTGMDSTSGQFEIAQPGDIITNFASVAQSGAYSDLIGSPTIPAAQVNSDWNAGSGITQILNKPSLATVATSGAYSDLSGKPALATVATSGSYTDLINQPSIPAAQIQADWNEATTSALDFIKNKPTIPSTIRTTSTLSLALVGTGATGTQISNTKDSTVRCTFSTSTTSTIGGPATSVVALKICATNSATEGNWTTVGTIESDQTITLAVVLQSIQVVKGQICADLPTSWFVKAVNSGTGTHTEASISGQQTIYG